MPGVVEPDSIMVRVLECKVEDLVLVLAEIHHLGVFSRSGGKIWGANK